MDNKQNRVISMTDEAERLAVLNRYQIMDTPPESSFDDLALLASQIFQLPMCLITFISDDRVFFKAKVGFGEETSEAREGSIYTQTFLNDEVLVVEDVDTIPHLADNIYRVRFYAGAALVNADGYRLGTICVMDHQPGQFDERKADILKGIAKMVVDKVELRRIGLEGESLKKDHEVLVTENEEMSVRQHNLLEFQEQVTEANSHLEALQESFQKLFERAPIGIGICSVPDKIFRQANKTLLEILGKQDSIVGESILSVLPDVEGQSFLQAIQSVIESGESVQASAVKLQVVHANQLKDVYVSYSIERIGRLGDVAQHVIFILTDVTEQVIAQQLTEEANIVLQSALEAGSVGHTIVEFSTGRMESNAQLKHNYGFAADEEFNYSDLFEAMVPKYRLKIKQAVQEAIENNGIYRAEYEVKWRDGSMHWIRAYGKPKYDQYGRASHIIGLNKLIDDPGL